MPVTAVGKIFKPALRRDQVNRVFGEALAPLSDESIEVSLETDDEGGGALHTRVLLQGSGVDEDAITERVNGLLGQYTVPFQVEWR